MATRKKKQVDKTALYEGPKHVTLYPQVTKGSHLTVTTYEDGRTDLVWDDEALMRDVREAIASLNKK